jgi:hypothetical protein
MSSIKLKHSGGNSVSLNPPTSAPTSSEVSFKLPNADGSANQVIKTDASGNLSFIEKGKVLQFKTSASSATGSGLPSYSTNNINNTETTIGPTLTINRLSADSYFLITVSALIGRDATSSWGYLGYQYSFAGASTNNIYSHTTDNASSVRYTIQYINSTSGSVGDAVVVQGFYKNTASHNDNVRQATINIMEYQP